ncbi:MAG: hypothetical protein QCI00_08850 [Candidatus Thermoplasmatota archaeon]|nr:hypothetical protein [Candidatus Thermoplasmatota archaeon]
MNKDLESFDSKIVTDRENKHTEGCVCPQCGYETSKRSNVYCTQINCPICNVSLVEK